MDPKQSAAKSQTSKSSSGSTGSYPGGGKKKKGGTGDIDTLTAEEETPITISGGSINVDFDPDFDDGVTPGRKVKKAKSPPASPGLRFTRVVIRKGRNGPILNEYPQPGLELSQGCVIEIKGQK